MSLPTPFSLLTFLIRPQTLLPVYISVAVNIYLKVARTSRGNPSIHFDLHFRPTLTLFSTPPSPFSLRIGTLATPRRLSKSLVRPLPSVTSPSQHSWTLFVRTRFIYRLCRGPLTPVSPSVQNDGTIPTVTYVENFYPKLNRNSVVRTV